MVFFVRTQLKEYVSRREYMFLGKAALPARTKGAIAVSLRILHKNCVFIGCHLPHSSAKRRIEAYQRIASKIHFRWMDTALLNPLVEDPLKLADVVFWFGDLNFRLNYAVPVEDPLPFDSSEIHTSIYLKLQHDELYLESTKGTIFNGFREALIHFVPTYKYVPGSHKLDKERTPSYTDRVLYWSHDNTLVRTVLYDSHASSTLSDHKSVHCLFRLRIYTPVYRPFIQNN
ncbi:hypothetical protein L596_003317 [Steinernema carpocapsae]|uniref:Inositol polyphosphate-related phosphatase domain-containing protein n=1 Tax=Steinernema carpocapsae TaxID=34508 RepID=A0A4U8UT64_STECR|nr:hypothetical protein L596_003317 [Steinernema carpocapsae]